MSTKHTFECPRCQHKFNKMYQLLKHTREVHNIISFYSDRHSNESLQQLLNNAMTIGLTNVDKKKVKTLINLVNSPFH